jgi:hypothetical protein
MLHPSDKIRDDGHDTAELIRSFTDDSVICFTDGACIGNPGPAGAAAVICLPHEHSNQTASGKAPKKDVAYNKGRAKHITIAKPGTNQAGEWRETSLALGNVITVHQISSTLCDFNIIL